MKRATLIGGSQRGKRGVGVIAVESTKVNGARVSRRKGVLARKVLLACLPLVAMAMITGCATSSKPGASSSQALVLDLSAHQQPFTAYQQPLTVFDPVKARHEFEALPFKLEGESI